jgi:hypothetical protein
MVHAFVLRGSGVVGAGPGRDRGQQPDKSGGTRIPANGLHMKELIVLLSDPPS